MPQQFNSKTYNLKYYNERRTYKSLHTLRLFTKYVELKNNNKPTSNTMPLKFHRDVALSLSQSNVFSINFYYTNIHIFI